MSKPQTHPDRLDLTIRREIYQARREGAALVLTFVTLTVFFFSLYLIATAQELLGGFGLVLTGFCTWLITVLEESE